MYHTDENVLLGAPTGSGKTISAELAVLRCFAAHPGQKIIYVAPLKVCCLYDAVLPAEPIMTRHSPQVWAWGLWPASMMFYESAATMQ
jgi:Rad3-related DNA helicase